MKEEYKKRDYFFPAKNVQIPKKKNKTPHDSRKDLTEQFERNKHEEVQKLYT